MQQQRHSIKSTPSQLLQLHLQSHPHPHPHRSKQPLSSFFCLSLYSRSCSSVGDMSFHCFISWRMV